MPTKTKVAAASDDDGLLDSHVAAKSFIFKGRRFLPGEPITIAVFTHPRFETLIRTGRVKAV